MNKCIFYLFLLSAFAGIAAAQQQSAPLANVETAAVELPDSPGFVASATNDNKHSASIFGTVTDPSGQIVPQARIVLTDLAQHKEQQIRSSETGAFTFDNLQPGRYSIKVTATGMGEYFSQEIVLKDGDARIVPNVMLPIASTSTEIHVYANRDTIAQEEVNIAVDQRVLGVLPNFYSVYDWHASPLGAKQKFELAFHASTDPVAFAGYGFVAAIEQAQNTFPGYGQGMAGYGKRYGAAFANDFIGRMTGSAIYPSLFHQDPRYFYKGTGSTKSRVLYAISQAVLCRGDNGHQEINFSHILGSLTAGALSNLYFPQSERGVSLTFTNTLVGTAGNALNNIVREFVLKGITTRGKGNPAP